MKKQKLAKILLSIYLALAFLTIVSYAIGDVLALNSGGGHPTLASLLLVLVSILLSLVSSGLYLFVILYFHYQKRYLFLLLAPFLGGMFFAVIALISKSEGQDFRLQGKIWNFAALFGLMGLDQTTGSLFQYFAINSKLVTWQIIIDLIFFTLTLAYFIYWGRKRVKAWSVKNFWSCKWAILIGIVVMIAWNFAWPAFVSFFHTSIPVGDNQSTLNQLATHTPTWLMWLHVSIGAPIMEESIFRLGIYELISPKHSKIAFFASAIVFAFLHMANGSIADWRVWGVYLGMGLILSAVYYKMRKVEATATIHFLWNGIVTWLLP